MKANKDILAALIMTVLVLITIVFISTSTACNKQIIDTTWSFDYAYIKLPNGEVVEGPVDSWKDYDGEQLQVKIKGITYLTNSYNCVLIDK